MDTEDSKMKDEVNEQDLLNQVIAEKLKKKPWRFVKFEEKPKELIDETLKTME